MASVLYDFSWDDQADLGVWDACMGTSVACRTLDFMLAASELAAAVGRAQRLFWFFRHGDVRGEQQLEAVAAHMDACAASAERSRQGLT